MKVWLFKMNSSRRIALLSYFRLALMARYVLMESGWRPFDDE
jgi:hypothetical protein